MIVYLICHYTVPNEPCLLTRCCTATCFSRRFLSWAMRSDTRMERVEMRMVRWVCGTSLGDRQPCANLQEDSSPEVVQACRAKTQCDLGKRLYKISD